MYLVYARLEALLSSDGALYAYSDAVYLLSDPISMAIYNKVGLWIGWGPGKMELILPSDCDLAAFLAHMEATGGG